MDENMSYTFDQVYTITLAEGQPEAKSVLTQVEFVLASLRARGGHLLKLVHDESLGRSLVRLRGEVRRLLRAAKKEGRVLLMIPGEKFSAADDMTRYLIEKRPGVELDEDMDKKNDHITVVYF